MTVENIRPRLRAGYFVPGAKWTFVHADGKRVDYVMDRCMAPAYADPDGKRPGLVAVYALRNPVTLKEAQVSENWLRKGPQQASGWWLAVAEAYEDTAAA